MLEDDRTDPTTQESLNPSPVQPLAAPLLTYTDQLKQDFGRIFETLPLSPVQREFLRARWLDQVLWMENKAAFCRDRHHRLRLTTIILGIVVPILVGFNINNPKVDRLLKTTTVVLSGMVAISSAVDEFFQYGERWYNYRRAAESLKALGWQFFQLSGPYRTYKTHQDAFISFVNQVEEVIERDVEVYGTKSRQSEDQELSNTQQKPLPAK